MAGFIMLARLGVVELDMTWSNAMSAIDPERSLLRAEVDGIKLAYDVSDDYYVGRGGTEARLTEVDYYFMRSFDPETHRDWAGCEKVFALGFNYHAEVPHRVFRDLDRADIRNYARLTARRLLRHERRSIAGAFEVEPAYCSRPNAIFYTRLWDPQGETPGCPLPAAVQVDRHNLNSLRVACLRQLRKAFEGRFSGGLEPTPYAVEHYPDLVEPRSSTSKRAYLGRMQASDICVATLGLGGSNGWKMGEYVAAGRAIVAEKMRCQVPGGFESPRNCLEYSTPDECVEQVAELLQNADLVYDMKVANHEYYLSYLRPDRMILRSLRIAMGEIVD